MHRGLYSAATGMSVAEISLDVISHNLANVGTTGYKRDALVFNEALERVLRAGGGRGGEIGPLGSGPGSKGVYTVFEQGPIQTTGNPLDVAIKGGRGMFAVETPNGVRFTRDGSFSRDVDGRLVDKNGFAVLDATMNPITLEAGGVDIRADGGVTAGGEEAATIGIFDGDFEKDGFGLYRSTNAAATEPGTVTMQQGAIEGSNVNAIEEMVLMIKLNRAFEMAQRSAMSQDESTQRLLQALQG